MLRGVTLVHNTKPSRYKSFPNRDGLKFFGGCETASLYFRECIGHQLRFWEGKRKRKKSLMGWFFRGAKGSTKARALNPTLKKPIEVGSPLAAWVPGFSFSVLCYQKIGEFSKYITCQIFWIYTRKKQKQNPKIIVQKATKFIQKMVMDGCYLKPISYTCKWVNDSIRASWAN